MRVERLHVTVSRPKADDGLGGYRDTEALGVVGARKTRADRERDAEEWARAEMNARARSHRLTPPGHGLGVLLGRR